MNSVPMISRRFVTTAMLSLTALSSALLASEPVVAQTTYPTKTIHLIVPFPPGGPTDVVARFLASGMQESFGQPVTVENHAGAGSNIGMGLAARANPDGYTLLVATTAFTINPSLYKNVPYDPFKDFIPIADLAASPNIFVADPKTGITSMAELVARAKANPGKLNYATPGSGTPTHLAAELLNQQANITLVKIPFPGGGQTAQAVLAGTTELASTALSNVQEYIRAGTLNALAITSADRWPDLPHVPTMIELGYPNFVSETGLFFLAPAGTRADIVEKLSKEAIAILRRPEVQDRLRQGGIGVIGGGPEALKARIAKEVPFFKKLAAAANIEMQ